jgi:hypothetical protein
LARYDIWNLNISPVVEDHIWLHGITPTQLDSVLDGDYTVVANRAGRAASHVLIGLDAQGRCIAAPIVPTDDTPGTWRVVTAWRCKRREAAILRRHLGR